MGGDGEEGEEDAGDCELHLDDTVTRTRGGLIGVG